MNIALLFHIRNSIKWKDPWHCIIIFYFTITSLLLLTTPTGVCPDVLLETSTSIKKTT